MRSLESEIFLKAYPPLYPYSDNQSFHYRKQSGCLFPITSLSCLSLEMGSKKESCTTVFAGTEVKASTWQHSRSYFLPFLNMTVLFAFSIHHDFSQTIHSSLGITAARKATTAANFSSTFRSVPGIQISPDEAVSSLFTQHWFFPKLFWYLQRSGRRYCPS